MRLTEGGRQRSAGTDEAVSTDPTTTREALIAAEITATRMARVETCDWASPAVREILAEYAGDLRDAIPFFVGLDRIRRAIEADRAHQSGRRPAGENAVRLAS
jgi:hypothetical protein